MQDEGTSAETTFAFGENWARFAAGIDDDTIGRAEAALRRLLERDSLEGLSFLDIGSGSGLHSLAALRLGCARLLAIDRDPDSAATTRRVLGAGAPGGRWDCRQLDILGPEAAGIGEFDIVYAWGVLHHTGAMFEAMDAALDRLAPGGTAVLALYRRTPLCPLWRRVKRGYARAPAWLQKLARGAFITLRWAGLLVRGRSVRRHIEAYPRENRGMDYFRDVHDWLGGYPYESAREAEVHRFLVSRGMVRVRAFTQRPGLGLLGTGNDEYVYRRP